MVAPKGSLEIHEEAWNAYPYCKTVLSNPGYMKGNFYIIVETYHLPDRGTQDNVHELEDKKLKKRSVVRIDIANDPVNSADFKADEDPTTFKSCKTGRGPLSGDWAVGFLIRTFLNEIQLHLKYSPTLVTQSVYPYVSLFVSYIIYVHTNHTFIFC